MDEILVDETICREPFYLHSNGVTVRCPNAAVGASGTVRTTEYTKRTVAQIQADHAIAAASCTSGISDMNRMFPGETSFDGDIGSWDVSSVTDMSEMFHLATAFNQDISSWDVSSVTDMFSMFRNASDFDQDLSDWCVSGIGSLPTAFSGGTRRSPLA